MPSRTLPFLRYRLKPYDRLVRAAALDRDTYAYVYAVIDVGDGEFDVAFREAGSNVRNREGVLEGATREEAESRAATYEARPMNGPRLWKFRHDWDDEASLVVALQRLQERWPVVVEDPGEYWIVMPSLPAPEQASVEVVHGDDQGEDHGDDYNPFLMPTKEDVIVEADALTAAIARLRDDFDGLEPDEKAQVPQSVRTLLEA